jgi:hypothetical protein
VAPDGLKKTEASIHKGEDRDLDVFIDREFGEDVHNLKGPADSLSHSLMDGQLGDLFVTKKDLPGIGQKIPREEVDEGCLARPVGTDDGGEYPCFNLEVDVICRADDTEIFSEFFRPEKFCHFYIQRLSVSV